MGADSQYVRCSLTSRPLVCAFLRSSTSTSSLPPLPESPRCSTTRCASLFSHAPWCSSQLLTICLPGCRFAGWETTTDTSPSSPLVTSDPTRPTSRSRHTRLPLTLPSLSSLLPTPSDLDSPSTSRSSTTRSSTLVRVSSAMTHRLQVSEPLTFTVSILYSGSSLPPCQAGFRRGHCRA